MARDTETLLRALRRWCLAAVLFTVAGLVASAVLGGLNQDEGWYLYAARRLMAGEIPHRDFFFTQGLAMPAAYALFGWLWSPAGVLGGRLFTAALSLAAFFVADGAVVSCCRKAEDRWMARLVLWSFLGLNLWYAYFTAIPKAYALCVLVMAGAFRLLTGVIPKEGLDPWCAASAGFLLAFAADIRLSMGVLVPTVGVWLVWRRTWAGKHTWLWFGLGAAAGLLLAFGPELLLWPEEFLEAQRFHAARESMGLTGRLGCVARLLRFNPVMAFIGLLLGLLWLTGKPALKVASDNRSALPQLWLCCAAALIAVHLLAPVPYDDYQIPSMLPLAMALAFGFTALPFDSLKLALAKTVALTALTVTCIGSPIAQDWVVLGQDRFWVRLKAEPDLFRLRHAARHVREAADRLKTDTLWTQDTYLAVEAGLNVPRGLEMGPFSKPMPLDTSAPIAAWSGYTFALRFPDLSLASDRDTRLKELQAAYRHNLRRFPDFGQQHTVLSVAERSAP